MAARESKMHLPLIARIFSGAGWLAGSFTVYMKLRRYCERNYDSEKPIHKQPLCLVSVLLSDAALGGAAACLYGLCTSPMDAFLMLTSYALVLDVDEMRRVYRRAASRNLISDAQGEQIAGEGVSD